MPGDPDGVTDGNGGVTDGPTLIEGLLLCGEEGDTPPAVEIFLERRARRALALAFLAYLEKNKNFF